MLRKIHKEVIQPVQDSKQHIQAVIDCMESILKEVEVGRLRKALVYTVPGFAATAMASRVPHL